MKEAYIVLDIETTGLSKYQHKITEIAALRIENFQVVKKFETLVNPESHIPSFITRLTGIDNKMVADSPKIEEVLPKFLKFVKGDPFVAHCASFDHGFIAHNVEKHLMSSINNQKICTRKITRRVLPNLANYKLSTIAQNFKIENEVKHRALADVETTEKIFRNLYELMKKRGIEKKEQILNFQDSKII